MSTSLGREVFPSSLRQVPAFMNDGQSAQEHVVLLRLRSDGQSLEALSTTEPHSPLLAWQLSQVTGLSGKEAIPTLRLRATPDNGQRIIIRSENSIAAVQGWLHPFNQQQKNLLWRKWVWGSLLVWSLGILFYFTSPMLFQMGADLVPVKWEEDMGANSLSTITEALRLISSEGGVVDNFEGAAELDIILQRLLKNEAPSPYTFSITVLKSSIVNAFALPGGYIVLTTGIIEESTSPEELAGVLAHELVHITHRHGTAGIIHSQVWSAIAGIFGISDSSTGQLAKIAVFFMSNGFSRDLEREADADGVEILRKAQISPLGMANFFGRIGGDAAESASSNAYLSYFSSHPDLKERQVTIREKYNRAPFQDLPILTPAQWKHLKSAAQNSRVKAVGKSDL